jgi:hypothetical protein
MIEAQAETDGSGPQVLGGISSLGQMSHLFGRQCWITIAGELSIQSGMGSLVQLLSEGGVSDGLATL